MVILKKKLAKIINFPVLHDKITIEQFVIRIWGKLRNFAFLRISVTIKLRYQLFLEGFRLLRHYLFFAWHE